MSRSRRKSLISGHTRQGSERDDKKEWHQRWRTHERTALQGASPEALEAHAPIARNHVTSPWLMNKDGRSWWSMDSRIAAAKRMAEKDGRTPAEQASIQTRLLRKWMSK